VTNTAARSLVYPLWLLVALGTVYLLRDASSVLVPIAIAVLISYALEPVVRRLERWRVPRTAGSALIVGLIAGAFGWGGYTLRDDVRDASRMLPQAAQRVRAFFVSPARGTMGDVREAIDTLTGRDTQQISGGTSRAEAPDAARSTPDAAESAGPGMTLQAGPVATAVQAAVGSVVTAAGYVVTIAFLVFLLLMTGDHFRRRLIEIASSAERRETVAGVVGEIEAQIQRFLLVRAITAAIVAAATWLVLAWMGVAEAAVWGILAGVFNSIPYFGPVIVSGGLLMIGLVQSGDLWRAAQMSGAALLITSLEGWLLTPVLLGRTERMHALVVFVGLLAWTWIWGAWGTILAVPMLVVIKAVADRVEPLKPLGRFLAP
jgi:predicted PurR-regulated permease PerM